jgi:hypothetical protein
MTAGKSIFFLRKSALIERRYSNWQVYASAYR